MRTRGVPVDRAPAEPDELDTVSVHQQSSLPLGPLAD